MENFRKMRKPILIVVGILMATPLLAAAVTNLHAILK
jgi:hypothetical protein